ncbi:hypothetical protein VE02_06595 [Pseudogymnoascus sp. 03VT05]|nr:hypothetical protein VE02_06595 [Pseudogymnoascus sp. 03VT05]
MDTKPSKDSGVEDVLEGAMRGALWSGMKPSRLRAVVMDVTGSNYVAIFKDAMKYSLDRGMKPDELINFAVEMAFKNQNQASKKIVPTEQPVTMGNTFKHETNPEKLASSTVEDDDSFAPAKINVVINRNSLPKRPVSTTWLPRKRIKTDTTEDRRDSDSSSLSEIRDSSSDLRTLPGIRIIKLVDA